MQEETAETPDVVRFDDGILDNLAEIVAFHDVDHTIQWANTPIIMLTGFGDVMNEQEELPAGVNLVIPKPSTIETLRCVIAKVMDEQGKPAMAGRSSK